MENLLMNERDSGQNRLLIILAAMIICGIILTIAGATLLEDDEYTTTGVPETEVESAVYKSTLHGGLTPVLHPTGEKVLHPVAEKEFDQAEENHGRQDVVPEAPAAERGVTVGELMRWAGILSIIISLGILIFIEFFYKGRITRTNYRLLLIISLFVLPVLITLGTTTTVLETTKTVQSCASCHVMDPFVNDLYDDESTSLAARHFKNRWIPEYQCYTCHTTYGAHGTIEGKRDGFRHWLLFVTRTWDEPITYSGSYPNLNCTACHGGSRDFTDVPSHQALSSRMRADEVSCTSCHGPAHPTPAERDAVPVRAAENSAQRNDSGLKKDPGQLYGELDQRSVAKLHVAPGFRDIRVLNQQDVTKLIEMFSEKSSVIQGEN